MTNGNNTIPTNPEDNQRTADRLTELVGKAPVFRSGENGWHSLYGAGRPTIMDNLIAALPNSSPNIKPEPTETLIPSLSPVSFK